MAYLWLTVFASISLYILLNDKRRYEQFKKAKTTKSRQVFYRSWLMQSFLIIGLPGLLALYTQHALGYLQHPVWAHPLFITMHRSFSEQFGSPGSIASLCIGVAFSVAAVSLLTAKRFKQNPNAKQVTAGDFAALLPRNKRETQYAAALSLSAGLNEELLFRVALPVTLLAVVHNPILAVVLSVFWFGVLHSYQGIVGVISTTIAGVLLMTLFLASGNILVTMLFHAFVDINSLVLQPSIARWAQGSKPAN